MSVFPFLACPLGHIWSCSCTSWYCSHDLHEQHQEGKECLMWAGSSWVCLCFSCHLLLANALAYLGHFIPQVHFHWYLYFWVTDKNIGKRILHDRIHLPSRSVELAGFQCYCYGVSSIPLYFSSQWYAVGLLKNCLTVLFFIFHSNCTDN